MYCILNAVVLSDKCQSRAHATAVADALIHYDLGDSKPSFGRRLLALDLRALERERFAIPDTAAPGLTEARPSSSLSNASSDSPAIPSAVAGTPVISKMPHVYVILPILFSPDLSSGKTGELIVRL